MNKKLVSLVLSGLIVLNSAGSLENIYAHSNNKSKELIKNEDTKSTKVIYLENGEGDKAIGDGSADKPYQNIRTALSKINDGDTLKIKGTVQYAKYNQDDNGGALPLEIDKAITIEGEAGAVFNVRGPIQLKDDVTFKDLNLELVPEVSLNGGIAKSSNRILGTPIERSNTIYANGHKLTLDNINTKVGTNVNQDKDRPYISGGSHKSSKAPTGKSIINIINSNDETKFSGIYAGDYNKELTLDVDINIDGNAKVVGNKIYTGGYNHILNGDVNINLSRSKSITGSNSITEFDKSSHNGDINVNLNEDVYIADFDAKDINNLTLEQGSKIILSKDATFDVNNVVLKNNATIDFSYMENNNPIVNGNFVGENIIDDSRKGGIILLGGDQVLDIKGKLSGTTILGESNREMFEAGCVYIRTHEVSDGIFILEDSISSYYELEGVQNGNGIDWTIEGYKEDFGNFEWIGDNKIEPMGEGTDLGEGIFKIKFENTDGIEYVPFDELYTDFEYILTVVDENGNEDVIYFDTENSEGIDDEGNVSFYFVGDGTEIKIAVYVQNMNNIKNKKMTLTATHIETKTSISKEIYNDIKVPEKPEETPEETPEVPEVPEKPEDTPEETPEVPEKPEETPEVPEIPEIPEEKPEETPEVPEDTPEDTLKPELSDIKDHWAENNILNFVKQGYINGYTDGTFKPDNSMTRAEFIKIANKVFGYNEIGTETFSDVNPGQWYYDEICIAVKAGYINGYTDGTFRPNDKITRQEVASIITSIKACKDSDLNKIKSYKDYNKIASWAKSSVEGAVERGYMGVGSKEFRPTDYITRAEAVTTLSRIK